MGKNLEIHLLVNYINCHKHHKSLAEKLLQKLKNGIAILKITKVTFSKYLLICYFIPYIISGKKEENKIPTVAIKRIMTNIFFFLPLRLELSIIKQL